MMALDERSRHEAVWLLLPWVASGRLSAADQEMAEEHLRHCSACERELALQQRMCDAFAQPDRVIYAPGPSFRKLMDRIDADSGASKVRSTARSRQPSLISRLGNVSLWRPPGLAWAASFLILFGITGMMVTTYRWSQPTYVTHTQASIVDPNVLHIALDRSLPIGEVEELLRAGGARIVEGPGNTGILGVSPIGIVPGQTTATSANKQLRALSARLRADPRVLWVQPLADEGTPAPLEGPGAADQRAPDAQEH
jgi:Putative zinc-finger